MSILTCLAFAVNVKCMETSSKNELALGFLEDLGRMKPERLRQVIETAVGEKLASTLFEYARKVIQADPSKIMENASSLLILGYLIKVHEEGAIPPENPPA